MFLTNSKHKGIAQIVGIWFVLYTFEYLCQEKMKLTIVYIKQLVK